MKPFWRRRLIVPFLVLAGLNLAVFLAYTLPRRMQEKNIASRAVVLREEVERERQAMADLRRRAETLESNNRDMARFYREVVGGRRMGLLPVIEELEGMAARLGIHRNTLAYRLKQIAALTGRDPTDPGCRLLLHLALLAATLPPAPEGGTEGPKSAAGAAEGRS